MTNITLIGMATAGKTHVGKPLAQKLGFEFVDIDELLQKAYKKSIQDILDEVGAEQYLELETEMLISGTSGRNGLVISPGGSIVYRDDAMKHAKDVSKVIYLQVPFETIEKRIQSRPPRAVIGPGSKSLRELYEERVPLYERYADIVIDTAPRTLEQVLNEIIDLLPATTP